MTSPPNAQAIDTAARTAWGEGRGTGTNGMHAILNVEVNRANHPSWWGHDIISVCREPWQFSCWNEGDPNRAKLLMVTEADPEFAEAVYLAKLAVAGVLADITQGADSYYARSMPEPPEWAARAKPVFADAWHLFFRLQDPAPSGLPEAPNVSVHAVKPKVLTADDLNEAELANLGTIG